MGTPSVIERITPDCAAARGSPTGAVAAAKFDIDADSAQEDLTRVVDCEDSLAL
jgi:hypothetical protein